jgi:nucleoside-diphosphate-sugar epimerase
MTIFITGASGFIGSAIAAELLDAGHSVLGLAHSEEGAARLKSLSIDTFKGDINDQESLRAGIEQADAVIHCAYMSGFDKIAEASQQEVAAITNLGRLLSGTDKPLLITSVAAMGASITGQPATEEYFDATNQNPRNATETTAEEVSNKGVKVSIVRLPQVHNTQKLGIVSNLIKIAKEKGVSAYLGEGANRWAAAHISDVGEVYRLVSEINQPARYHAVAEQGVSLKEIAEAIGERLNIPAISLHEEEAKTHFGPLAFFVGFDMSASSKKTQQILNWHPSGPGLIEDILQSSLF